MNESVIGKNIPRSDGHAKVTGTMVYPSDVIIPGMMYGAVLRSPHPHAEIVSVDTSEAERMGAVCLTYADINPIMYNERSVSIPAATYRDRTVLPSKARHFGEPLMAVAADTEELAHKAVKAIKIEYKVLEAVYDPDEAMKEGAPQLYENIYLGDNKLTVKNNIGVVRNIDEGDCAGGFARADRIFEHTFDLERIYHNQLETKCAVCKPEPDGSLTVWATAQSIHANRQLLARILNMPLSKLNVVRLPFGGAFGSSIQVNTVTPICACLALKAGRPVKLTSAREEDFYSHQKYPARFTVKMGVTNDGVITAAHVKALIDFGAHQVQPLPFMGCTAGWFASLYKYDGNIRFDGTAVYTNKTPCCAMQGYGNPQINFAIESMIDIICEEMRFSAVDFRLKNYRGIGDEFWGQGPTIRSIIKSCGVEQSLVEGRKMTDFENRQRPEDRTGDIRRGLGLARGFHTSGTAGPKEGEVIDYSSALIKINEDGSVDLVTPVTDHGGGTWDALKKITAETLQVPFDMVGLAPAATTNTGYDVCTHATRGVYCGGAAVYHVAMKVKERLLEYAGRLMAEHAYNLEVARRDELGQGVVQVKHFPSKFMTIGDIAKQAQIMSWGTIAYTDSYRQRNCPPCFTTHFVEVEIDTRTGVITVPKVLIFGDCGVALNPDLVKGQLIGSFNRGFGYTVFETMPLNEKTGELMNKGLLTDYKTPTSAEMPKIEDVEVILCDTYEPSGPYGAKGIGEAALASVQAAIANAVYNAVGIRFYKLPITPEVLLAALKKKEQEAAK
ncbi:MAG: xanthine dehydrogenase family protein molybdopterin-binding subunit [Christensenellaceae bacterium]|jgi:xanthine dehydrogenase molybdenum-binding subunit|nr:xanthine dehydrogenase family protein molybdopterin-binding subunit [Christensenellaceae bacterium]